MVECKLFMTHCLRLNLQLHTISLVRTCRISSFCTVAWHLARLLLTRRIARSLGDSWASCCFYLCSVLLERGLYWFVLATTICSTSLFLTSLVFQYSSRLITSVKADLWNSLSTLLQARFKVFYTWNPTVLNLGSLDFLQPAEIWTEAFWIWILDSSIHFSLHQETVKTPDIVILVNGS